MIESSEHNSIVEALRDDPISWSSTFSQADIAVMQIEVDQARDELRALLANPKAPTVKILLQFLSARWERIKDTDLSYFQFPFHPINLTY